jgi:hypothetical protein
VAAIVVKPNSYDGAVCAPRLLATPDVSTDIASVTFGDQSNKPGIDSRWSLSLNSFRTQKPASQRPTFDFTPEEGDRLVSVHPGGRQVVRILPCITPAPAMQRIDRARPTARPMRFQRGTFNTKHEHDGKAVGVVQGPPDLRRPDAPASFASTTTTRTGCRRWSSRTCPKEPPSAELRRFVGSRGPGWRKRVAFDRRPPRTTEGAARRDAPSVA